MTGIYRSRNKNWNTYILPGRSHVLILLSKLIPRVKRSMTYFKYSLLVQTSPKCHPGGTISADLFLLCSFSFQLSMGPLVARESTQNSVEHTLVFKSSSGVCILIWPFRRNQSVSIPVPFVAPDYFQQITTVSAGRFVMRLTLAFVWDFGSDLFSCVKTLVSSSLPQRFCVK